MHQSSYEKMTSFRDRYLGERTGDPLKILDLGSYDVNGSYKSLFDEPVWIYKGLDLVPGKNVDIVLHNPYDWNEIPSGSVDVFITGQAFEHIEYFWITILEIERVLKFDGICCIIAPSGGYEHRYPVDCWRFYPDGFRALAKFAGLEVLETYAQWDAVDRYTDDSNKWQDAVLVAKKTRKKIQNRFSRKMARFFLRRMVKERGSE